MSWHQRGITYGAIFGKHCVLWPFSYSMALPFKIKLYSSLFITLALHFWGPTMANSCVLFFTDNAALVDIINKRTSKTLTGHDSFSVTLYSAMAKYWGGGGNISYFFEPAASPTQRRVLHLPFTNGGIQGSLAGGGQRSNSSANDPTAGKLVTHYRENCY